MTDQHLTKEDLDQLPVGAVVREHVPSRQDGYSDYQKQPDQTWQVIDSNNEDWPLAKLFAELGVFPLPFNTSEELTEDERKSVSLVSNEEERAAA